MPQAPLGGDHLAPPMHFLRGFSPPPAYFGPSVYRMAPPRFHNHSVCHSAPSSPGTNWSVLISARGSCRLGLGDLEEGPKGPLGVGWGVGVEGGWAPIGTLRGDRRVPPPPCIPGPPSFSTAPLHSGAGRCFGFRIECLGAAATKGDHLDPGREAPPAQVPETVVGPSQSGRPHGILLSEEDVDLSSGGFPTSEDSACYACNWCRPAKCVCVPRLPVLTSPVA
jgi:hypothetical protein